MLTVVYIINRFPTATLEFQTPYFTLHKTPIDYGYMKAFGCLVFASNPKPDNDKLLEKGVACVFFGYAPFQKGYKLMNSVTKQTFVTRDARFYEGIFPFNSNFTKPYIQPLPVDVPHVQPGYVDCDDFLVESIVPVDLDTSSHVDTSHQSNPPDINLRRSTM